MTYISELWKVSYKKKIKHECVTCNQNYNKTWRWNDYFIYLLLLFLLSICGSELLYVAMWNKTTNEKYDEDPFFYEFYSSAEPLLRSEYEGLPFHKKHVQKIIIWYNNTSETVSSTTFHVCFFDVGRPLYLFFSFVSFTLTPQALQLRSSKCVSNKIHLKYFDWSNIIVVPNLFLYHIESLRQKNSGAFEKLIRRHLIGLNDFHWKQTNERRSTFESSKCDASRVVSDQIIMDSDRDLIKTSRRSIVRESSSLKPKDNPATIKADSTDYWHSR